MPQQNFELKVDTGAITVPVVDEIDGEKIGSFKFNPSDLDIVKRYKEVAENFNSISVSEEPSETEVLEVSERLKEQIDYLLNYNVSGELFAKCNPLTPTSSGDFFIENIMSGIAEIIEMATNQRIEKKKAKIRKATAKYHK